MALREADRVVPCLFNQYARIKRHRFVVDRPIRKFSGVTKGEMVLAISPPRMPPTQSGAARSQGGTDPHPLT